MRVSKPILRLEIFHTVDLLCIERMKIEKSYPQIFENSVMILNTDLSEEVNRQLCELALKRCLPISERTENQFNFTTWNTDNLLINEPTVMHIFRDILIASVRQYADALWQQSRSKKPNYGTAWVNIIRNFDGSVPPHRHHTNPFNLVAVYYAAGEFSKQSGGTQFWQPGAQKPLLTLHPRVGELALFSATTLHSIALYQQAAPRITFGFDIRFREEDFQSHPCTQLNLQRLCSV